MRKDRFGSVEINVHLVLTGDQVLRLGRISRVHVAHPVGFRRIVAINIIKHFAIVVNLCNKYKISKFYVNLVIIF